MPRRILQIIPTLDRSGAEKQLALLAAGLPRDEYDVHVCVLTRDGPLRQVLDEHEIPVTVIGKRYKLDPFAYARLKRHIVRLRPDLVQTWIFAANAYGRAAALAAGVRRVVASERCVDPWKRWHELAIDRRLARRTDRIVVNSSGITDFYTRQGLPADKFTLIPNGVDLPGPSRITRPQLLEELRLPEGTRLAAAVGRLWPQKRVKDLIQVMEMLCMIRDDLALLVIGDGPLADRLRSFADDLQLGRKVLFLGHRSDVPDVLPHVDMLWLASEYEGLPNVVMEAMAAGVPVIASDIPGNRDLVVPGETGYLAPLGDRPLFARRAEEILNDKNLAARLGAAGRTRMAEEFSVARMIERYRRLYTELLD